MIKTENLKISKNIVGDFKAKIYEKIALKKKLDEEYEKYLCNAIMEAEESLKKGEKTYTWEEWTKIREEWDEEDV